MAKKAKKIETTITFLEMKKAPAFSPPHPIGRYVLMKLRNPSLSFYRYLYSEVGKSWLWWERNVMSDDELKVIINDEEVHIFVLYVDGAPGGYFELDYRNTPTMELAYFGLIPELIGKGYGAYLLNAAIHEAWSNDPYRLWVHTCNFDHPNALRLYQRAGFEVYKQETKIINNPRVE